LWGLSTGGIGLEAVIRVAVERVRALKPSVLGVGTGTTSNAFIRAVAAELGPGSVDAVIPSSIQAESLAAELGFRVGSLYSYPAIDVYVDSFDQCSASGDMLKGMGGALAREKVLAALARRPIFIGTEEKFAERLAGPIPLEVLPFAAPAVQRLLGMRGWRATPRLSGGKAGPVITDNGNVLMLVELGVIEGAARLEAELKALPGVVEVGIFPNRGYEVLVGKNGGRVMVVSAPASRPSG